MRKSSILIVIALFISACVSNTPEPNPLSASDQIATIVASTLAAMNTQLPATEVPATPTPPMDGFSINGQLQGTLAFIRNNNLWIKINSVEYQLTNDADPSDIGLPRLWYSNPQISPDGTKIGYLKNAGTNVRTLMIYDIKSRNMTQIANDAAWVPPAVEWSNDSQKIYYPVSNGFDMTTGLETIVVKSINLATGEVQEQGQYGVQTGCGGGSPDPADGISNLENVGPFGGNVFSLSPQNNFLIHTTSCTSFGLGILNLAAQQDQVLDDYASRAVISPDGSKIAAVSDNNIITFNVNTGGIESKFPTTGTPRALLWSADGKAILYSTSSLINTVTLDDNVALDLFGSAPTAFKLNVSTLWVVSLDSGQSNKIIEVEAHDLKPIFVKGQKVLVVIVENANKLFDYVNQGNRDNLTDYYPTSNIVEVDLANSSSNTILNNARQAVYFK
jgi:hypothetical protein